MTMIRGFVAAIALSLGVMSQASAYRVIEQLETAYELRLGVVTFPGDANGSVIFTPCSTCRTMSLRVSDQTRYFIAGQLVDLADFRERVDALRATIDGQQRGVFIYADNESLRVTRLALGR
jgi:hypothetical protein